VNEKKAMENKELDNLVRNYVSIAPRLFGGIFQYIKRDYKTAIDVGARIRNQLIHKYNIVPGAINTFISIASSRKWNVIGSPSACVRAVHRYNSSYFVDEHGIYHEGFEQLISRMCMDWLTVGRCAFSSMPLENREWTPPEYIDTTYLMPKYNDNGTKMVWDYRTNTLLNQTKQRDIEQDNLFFLDNIRIGNKGIFIGSIAYLIPLAHLDWLIRNHDEMQLDGRKIRDIFLVKEGMRDSISDAIIASMAISAGEDLSKHGLPVVEISSYGEQSITDMFARIGLSEIPREFSREEFEGRYVREIAATLGLPIGQFWYDPRGTNRSLEQVTQERSTLKGPSYFIRSLERMINNAPFSNRSHGQRTIIQFEEETDNSSLLLKAEAVLKYATAIEKLQTLAINMGEDLGQFKWSQWMHFFESNNLIPRNTTLPDMIALEEDSLSRNYNMNEEEQYELREYLLNKGQVRMDSNGLVLERRQDFQIQKPEVKQNEKQKESL